MVSYHGTIRKDSPYTHPSSWASCWFQGGSLLAVPHVCFSTQHHPVKHENTHWYDHSSGTAKGSLNMMKIAVCLLDFG